MTREDLTYRIVRDAVERTNPVWKNNQIQSLIEYPFNTFIDGQECSFPCEIVRVYLPDHTSRVYRVIKSPNLKTQRDGRIMVLDNRGNSDKELSSELFPVQYLTEAYRGLQDGELAAVITAVREGAMGPTHKEIPESSGLPVFTTDALKYPVETSKVFNNPKEPWDIKEEYKIAQAIYLAYSTGDITPLNEYLNIIAQDHTKYALQLANYLEAELGMLFDNLSQDVLAEGSKHALSEQDLAFFNDRTEFTTVNLGKGGQHLERIVAYPYPTEKGTVFITLYRLWDIKIQRYRVARVIQTQPHSENIEGIRIDSNCTDGVHSLDCHCDCCAQLWAAINYGLDSKKNVWVIEEEDHEGKSWGVVHKGATHYIMRNYNKRKPKDAELMGNPTAAAYYYGVHDIIQHDNRGYQASKAIIKAKGITKVNLALTGNQDKADILRMAGVEYNSMVSVDVDKSQLSPTALQGMKEKKNGIIQGKAGAVLYEGEEKKPNTHRQKWKSLRNAESGN